MTNGYRGFFWGDENVLELDSDDDCTTLWKYKKTELYSLKGWIFCMWTIAPKIYVFFFNSHFEAFLDHHSDVNFFHGLMAATSERQAFFPVLLDIKATFIADPWRTQSEFSSFTWYHRPLGSQNYGQKVPC